MGAFYLVFDADGAARERTVARLRSAYQEQGFVAPQCLELPRMSLGFFGKLAGNVAQLAQDEQGRFAGLTGTVLVNDAVGLDAARALLASNYTAVPRWSTLLGSFCAVVGDRSAQRLFLDPLGVHKVYTDRSQRVFASSFLALAASVESRTANPQGVYEYVHQEATYGRDTVLNEVVQASCRGCYVFTDAVDFQPWPRAARPQIEVAAMDVHLDRCLQRLRSIFISLSRCFGDRIDTALSGGYDSRLTLALLQEQGVQPAVHVYGHANSADVKVAQAIAAAESFALDHVDKAQFRQPSIDEFTNIVRRNFFAFDGWPPSGIFDSGADLETRKMRASGERLMLNGGGGEIFRNFFYLPSHIHSPRQVVHSFYNRYAPRWCTSEFDEQRYLKALQDKLADALDLSGAMTRADVEMAYPVFRCGFWMGRNNALNNRLGWTMTPFIDHELVQLAVRVPLALKNHGHFEAAMIRKVSPRLAGYLSDYGHNFAGPAPISRQIKDWLIFLRPPALRRLTYRVRFRQPQPMPTLLKPDYLYNIVNPSMPHMSRFYQLASVNDPSAFARIASLEYLFETLGVS